MRRAVLVTGFVLSAIVYLGILTAPAAQAQSNPPVLITQIIDESKLVTLSGNTRPEATAKYDRGRAPADFVIEHMLLQLQRSPEQERELEQLIGELTEKSSPNFQHWLTAQEFGERFGLAQQDRDAIKRWLESHNLKVNVDYTNGILIDFSGTADAVREAFHSEIHQLNVKGEKHFANMSDPQIPAALAPAIAGVVALHDFKPHAMHKMRVNYTTASGYDLVVPGDLEEIYNFNPAFSGGISGQGQTIVVLEDTDVYTTADWATFRSAFGLSSYTGGSFTQTHPAPPSGTNNCTDPGFNADDGEAILDAEYASAAAPSAAIVLASCTDTATFGGLIALQNILNGTGAQPETVSMSYGECEAYNGAASNAAFNSAFQQAVTQGVSMFVSAGDSGGALCDDGADEATHGIGVNGFGSSPYAVSVGGTDYGDTYAGTNSTYWNSTNTSTYESAKSYIDEIPWNDSCASVLISTYLGYDEAYGSNGFCNSSLASAFGFLNTVGGSGGPSGCATGSPSTAGVVSGTCKGWAKPSYQSVFGNPSDGVRDMPDVSLFAANGVWGHYYVFCWSDPNNGGTPCTGAPDNWSGAGGTSFSSPIWAGIQALVDQIAGGRQGPVNQVYYSLANSEYGASGDSSCNSTLGNAVSSSCVFYDVTQGDMDVDCSGSHNCYLDSASIGVLSTSDSAYDIAYGTQTGWDFATGIGTVNVNNLMNAWPSSRTGTSTGLTSSLNPSQYNQPVTFTATVTPTPNGGTVTFTYGTTTLCSSVSLTSGQATCAYSTLPVGPDTVMAAYSGDTSYAASSGTTAQTVNAATTTTGATSSLNPSEYEQSVTFTATVTPTPDGGTVNFTYGATTLCSNVSLTSGKATCAYAALPVGSDTVTATYSGDTNYSGSSGMVAQSVSSSTVTVSVTALSFGDEVVSGTSAAKAVTLKDTGSGLVNISSIAITPSTNYTISSNTCGSTLAAGKGCTVKVEFEPTALGALTASLAFSDNASNSPQTVALSGTGTVDATLTPASAAYGAETVGTTSAAKTFTLANKQAGALTSIAISTTGDFAVSMTTCGTSLGAETKCTVSVTFTPTATGTQTGQLIISDSASTSPQTANLTGTGK